MWIRGPCRTRLFTYLVSTIILCTIYLLLPRREQTLEDFEKMHGLTEEQIRQLVASENEAAKLKLIQAAENSRKTQVMEHQIEEDLEYILHHLGHLQRGNRKPPPPIQMPEPEFEEDLLPEEVRRPVIDLKFIPPPTTASPTSSSTSQDPSTGQKSFGNRNPNS